MSFLRTKGTGQFKVLSNASLRCKYTPSVPEQATSVPDQATSVTVTVVDSKFVFTPVVNYFTIGNSYIFDNTANYLQHPLNFHPSSDRGTTNEGPYDLSFGDNKAVFLNDGTSGDGTTITTNLTNTNTKLSIRSTSVGWSYVKLNQTIDMTIGNEYQFDFYMDQTGLSKRYGGIIFGHNFSLNSPHQGNPNHPDAINFAFKLYANNSNWDAWHNNRLSVVWRDANNNPSPTSNDPTSSGVSALTTAFVRYWKLTVIQREDNGLKDLKMEGFSDSNRTSLVYWAYVSEIDTRSTDTDIQALQHGTIHIGIVHGSSIGTNEYTILENFTAVKLNPYLYTQDNNGYLELSNITDEHTHLFAHCGIHANMGSDVNGINGIPMINGDAYKYIDSVTGEEVFVTLEHEVTDGTESLVKVLGIPEPVVPFTTLSTSHVTANGALEYTDSGKTANLIVTNKTSTNGDETYARFNQTLDPTDGKVYNFELYPEGTLDRLVFGLLFGDMGDMSELNKDATTIKLRFMFFPNEPIPSFYTWFSTTGAWRHGVTEEPLSTGIPEFNSANTDLEYKSFPNYWSLEFVTHNGNKDAILSTYSDSDRTTRLMYGYLSEVARGNPPDMSKFQQTSINVGLYASTYQDSGNTGYYPDSLTYRLSPTELIIPQLLDDSGNIVYTNVSVDANGNVNYSTP